MTTSGSAALALGAVSTGAAAVFWPHELSPAALDLGFAVVMGLGVLRLGRSFGVARAPAATGAVALAGAAVAVVVALPAARLTPYLGLAVVNAVLALVFARGLRVGRTPVIRQLIELMGAGPPISPDFDRFVRDQCRAWTALAAATAGIATLAMLAPAARGPLDPTLAGLLGAQVLWFVLTHRYANRRYGRPETWRMTLALMVRPRTWRALRI